MDLDSIKKVWQVTTIKPAITNEDIKKILENKSKSAFDRLIKYEKWGLVAMIFCMPLSFVFRDMPIITAYLFSIFFILIWQIYKYRFLTKISLSEMGIIEISNNINRYKKYLSFELIGGIIWTLSFTLFWCSTTIYTELAKNIHKDGTLLAKPIVSMLAIYIAVSSFSIIVTWILYKKMYTRNIKKIEKAIEEVKEFQKDNQL